MKNLFLISFLILPITTFAQFDLTVGLAYDWDELITRDQEKIRQSTDKYFTKLIQKDIQGFWESCHPQFKEQTPFIAFKEIGKIISELIPSHESIEFIDAKKVEYTDPPGTVKFSTGGSVNQDDPNYLQFYTLAGIEVQSIVLFKVNSAPISKMITMKLGYENASFKLTNFQINSCSFNGRDAEYYIDLAKKWENKISSVPEFLALNMAYRLAYLGQGTASKKIIDLTEKIQELQKNEELIHEIKKWNVGNSNYDIFNVDFIETRSDITPNISYLSQVELGDNTTTSEANQLFQHFSNKYPDLVLEFEKFVFTAYEEYPALPTKEYKYFRVIMDINENQ